MRVISCLFTEHDFFVVLLAALICVIGCAVSMRVMRRAEDNSGMTRASWIFLTAVSLGATIWSTHFVAMLGYKPNAPVTLDAGLTALSAVIMIVGAVVTLARSLEVPILAEGVETADQLDQLRLEGCDQIQGFLFGRPCALIDGASIEPTAHQFTNLEGVRPADRKAS